MEILEGTYADLESGDSVLGYDKYSCAAGLEWRSCSNVSAAISFADHPLEDLVDKLWNLLMHLPNFRSLLCSIHYNIPSTRPPVNNEYFVMV